MKRQISFGGIVLTIIMVTGLAIAQKQETVAPQLTNKETNKNQIYTNGKDYFYRQPNEAEIPLPIDSNITITGTMPIEFSTKGLKEDSILKLPLTSIYQVKGKYAVYLESNELIYTEFTGKESGFFRRAYITVQPKNVTVKFDRSIVIGIKNGLPILLDPGIYELNLETHLQSIQLSDRFNYNFPLNKEDVKYKAPSFKKDGQIGVCEEKVAPTVSTFVATLPAYGLCKLSDLIMFFIRRPNWVLPAGTMLTFHVDRITATKMPEGVANLDELRPVN